MWDVRLQSDDSSGCEEALEQAAPLEREGGGWLEFNIIDKINKQLFMTNKILKIFFVIIYAFIFVWNLFECIIL